VVIKSASVIKIRALGERVNHDSWVKMYNLCRVLKTSILAELTVRSGLVDIYIKGDDSYVLNMLIVYCLMLYIIYVMLIMRLWELYNPVAILVEFDMDSPLLFPHTPQEKFWACDQPVVDGP